ncbi:unnamed protein product [Blepharisma stoltei]|uniref:RING-type E3 ubiquitin transferase n=1 Tax=Blepharisma stoltei TaxID=1481888 RepID=A0AAU9J2E1_9CILI|nr:unnamed protein product [Blepharisma stoltei]
MIILIGFLGILTLAKIVPRPSKGSYISFQVPTQNLDYLLLISIDKIDGSPSLLILSQSGAFSAIENAIKNGIQLLLTNYYKQSLVLYIVLPNSVANMAGNDVWYVEIIKSSENEIGFNLELIWDDSDKSYSQCLNSGWCESSWCICKSSNYGQLSSIDQFHIDSNSQLEIKSEANEWQFYYIHMKENHNMLDFTFSSISGLTKIYVIEKSDYSSPVTIFLYEEIIVAYARKLIYLIELSKSGNGLIIIGFHCQSPVDCIGNLNLTSYYEQGSSHSQPNQAIPISMFIFACFCLPIVLCALLRLKNYIKNRGSAWKEIERNCKMTKWASTDDSNAPLCVICLEEFVKECRVKALPCQHIFHTQCIDPWVKKKVACPICKRTIKAS